MLCRSSTATTHASRLWTTEELSDTTATVARGRAARLLRHRFDVAEKEETHMQSLLSGVVERAMLGASRPVPPARVQGRSSSFGHLPTPLLAETPWI